MTLKIAFQQLSTISGSISKCRMQNFCVSSTKTPSPESQRNLYQMKNTKNRTVMPPPTANHVVEFSVAASFLYLADIIERFCDLLSNSVKKIAIYYTFCCPSISHIHLACTLHTRISERKIEHGKQCCTAGWQFNWIF